MHTFVHGCLNDQTRNPPKLNRKRKEININIEDEVKTRIHTVPFMVYVHCSSAPLNPDEQKKHCVNALIQSAETKRMDEDGEKNANQRENKNEIVMV